MSELLNKIRNTAYLAIALSCLLYILFSSNRLESKSDVVPDHGPKEFSMLHIANFVYAAETGDYETVYKYIRLGMNVNSQDHNNDTALMGASLNGHIQIIKLLLKHDANPLIENNQGYTALKFADIQERHKISGVLQNYSPPIERAISSTQDH